MELKEAYSNELHKLIDTIIETNKKLIKHGKKEIKNPNIKKFLML
jgi:hypothetical protein